MRSSACTSAQLVDIRRPPNWSLCAGHCAQIEQQCSGAWRGKEGILVRSQDRTPCIAKGAGHHRNHVQQISTVLSCNSRTGIESVHWRAIRAALAKVENILNCRVACCKVAQADHADQRYQESPFSTCCTTIPNVLMTQFLLDKHSTQLLLESMYHGRADKHLHCATAKAWPFRTPPLVLPVEIFQEMAPSEFCLWQVRYQMGIRYHGSACMRGSAGPFRHKHAAARRNSVVRPAAYPVARCPRRSFKQESGRFIDSDDPQMNRTCRYPHLKILI